MEYIFLIIISALTVYIIYSNIKKQLKGECGCSSNCSGCVNKCNCQEKQ